MTSVPQTSSTTQHRMECMELWGGSREVDTTVAMTGLNAQVYSRAYGEGQHGGDVYYFSSCASGRISRILLADVTGHGQAVADTATMLRESMRDNVNVINQGTLVATLNEEFGKITRAGGFATAVVLTHFSPTKSISVTVAGHPPPFVYRAETGKWSMLVDSAPSLSRQLQDLPLGITGESAYTSTSLKIHPGDQMLIYTDAFSESVDASGKMFGISGLCQLLNGMNSIDPKEALNGLITELRRHSDDNLTNDDATAVLLEPTGQRISLKQNLLAPWRMTQGVTDTQV